jgi:hypothetical protein
MFFYCFILFLYSRIREALTISNVIPIFVCEVNLLTSAMLSVKIQFVPLKVLDTKCYVLFIVQ